MRINVYSQELTREIALVQQTAHDTGITYFGVRLFLASPDVLHNTPDDDDRSAITFWIPNAQSYNRNQLAAVFNQLALLVREAPPPGEILAAEEVNRITRHVEAMVRSD